MDLSTDRIPESAPPFEGALASPVLPDEGPKADLHAEINARRAQIEDPEMLRRLRSL
jgi:hypothetical protein